MLTNKSKVKPDYRFYTHGMEMENAPSVSTKISTYKGAYISLTSNCNMTCDYCYANNQPKAELSVEDFRQILDWLEEISDFKEVYLVGGEPTMVPHLKELLEDVSARNWSATVYTNGAFGSKQRLLLKEHPSVARIAFHYEKAFFTTSKNMKETFLRNISELSSVKECSLLFVISEPNFDYSEPLALAEKEGLSLTWVFATPTSGNTPYVGLKTMREAGARVQKFLIEAKKKNIVVSPDLPVPLCIFTEDFLNDYQEYFSLVRKCKPFVYFQADMSTQSCTVMPCNSSKAPNSANSLRNTIEFYRNKDQALKQKVSFPECVNCKYHLNGTCQGGCMTYKIYASPEKEL
jgi:MoaA/NifB/PqqE/SkfB family radical SAM enzyme